MFRIALLLVLSWLSVALTAQDRDRIAKAEMQARKHLLKMERAGAVNNTDIIQQRLELSVNPEVKYITGKVNTVFVPQPSIDFLEFDLSDSLVVDSIIYHNSAMVFAHTNMVLHINLPQSVTQRDSIAVYYHGVPGGTGFGSFVQDKHDSIPIVWTLSEPYGARDWWPCKQNLQDKIDSLDVLITTPDTVRAASNGLLAQELHNGNQVTYHWKHRYPIASYLVCMAATNYAYYYDYVPYESDTLPVLNYVYPEDSVEARNATASIVRMIQLYDTLFGVYPFQDEKYGHAQFGWGGGMEHQTMTFMGDFGFELMAHELGHHWFGDKVTCGSWQDIWLNEGFATYLSGLCYEHIAPEWWYAFRRSRIDGSCVVPDGSVFCDDTTSVSRVFDPHLSYSKGAMVLHMLRYLLGDDVFFSGLRSYLNDQNLAYNFAKTGDLKAHLEAASGKNLTTFFTQWVYGRGYPSYQISWIQDFSNTLSLTINQSQSHPSVPFFNVPVQVRFKGQLGDTIITFDPAQNGENFVLDKFSFSVDTVEFDPNLWIIAKDNTVTRNSAYQLDMLVYPNPVNNQLQLRVETDEGRSPEIKIYNIKGQVMYSDARFIHSGSETLSIDVSNLAAGTYRIALRVPGKTITAPFVKTGK
ncbi:MAG: M1 family aminopeptidase [Chitinophagales bacterium]